MPTDEAPSPTPPESCVAVIAVHGIADQQPGETAAEIAHLLIDDPAKGYAAAETRALALPVETPALIDALSADQQGGWLRPAFVSARTAQARGSAAAPAAPYDIAYTDSFLQPLELPEADRVYRTTRIETVRREAHRTTRIHVHELYWADLSRLGSAIGRIVEEFYQLLFHLIYLAKLNIAHAVAVRPRDRHSPAFAALLYLHTASEWLLVRPIALVNLYLLLLLLVAVVVLLPPPFPALAVGAVLAVAWVAVLARLQWRGWIAAALILAAAGIALPSYAWPALTDWLADPSAALLVLPLAATALYAWIATFVIRRSRLADETNLVWPLIVWAGVLFTMPPLDGAALDNTMTLLLLVMEWGLVLLILHWVFLVLSNFGIYVTGTWIKWRSPRVADGQAIDTARLGVFLACTLFVVFTLLAFGVIEQVLIRPHLPAVGYQPFFDHILFARQSGNSIDLATASETMMARAANSFGVLAAMLGVAVLVSIYALLPSLARELWPKPGWLASTSVGRWLDAGIVLIGVCLWALFFLTSVGGPAFEGACIATQTARFCDALRGDFSLAINIVGGSAATVIALGNRLGGFMPAVRGVLDVILDVDNYFRDRNPRKTSRGRIHARAIGLLQHIARAKKPDGTAQYDRVVIVAHSQGTVITADLLRSLSHQGSLGELFGERPIHFVTAGSPLRQLYASRFPDLYSWVTEPLGAAPGGQAVSGPDPRALGLHSWTNLYQSGDYVGRTLWQEAGRTARYTVPTSSTGSTDILTCALPTCDVRELCVGSGAHTHYFDGSAPPVRAEIERRL